MHRPSGSLIAALLSAVLALSACATVTPQASSWTLDTPGIQAVRSAYVRCARVALVMLRDEAPLPSAEARAHAAEDQCAGQRQALSDAVVQANRGQCGVATFAQGHVEATRQRLIALLALTDRRPTRTGP